MAIANGKSPKIDYIGNLESGNIGLPTPATLTATTYPYPKRMLIFMVTALVMCAILLANVRFKLIDLRAEKLNELTYRLDHLYDTVANQNKVIKRFLRHVNAPKDKHIDWYLKQDSKSGSAENLVVQFGIDPYLNVTHPGVLGPWTETSPDFDNMVFPIDYKADQTKIEIFVAGLYYIYSQVSYLSNGTNSYSINVFSPFTVKGRFVNEAVASCSCSSPKDRETRTTCSTSSLQLLNFLDQIYLKQDQSSGTIFTDRRMTYFGMIMLNAS